jgi:hypothetical protein
MLFYISCSYGFSRFETSLEKLDILMPLDSVVWPADAPLCAEHRRQLWGHGESSTDRPLPHLTSAYVTVFHFCRLVIMFNGMPVAVVKCQPSLPTSVLSRLAERRKRRASPPKPSRVPLLGRSMVEMEESASRRSCVVVPYGLMSNDRR